MKEIEKEALGNPLPGNDHLLARRAPVLPTHMVLAETMIIASQTRDITSRATVPSIGDVSVPQIENKYSDNSSSSPEAEQQRIQRLATSIQKRGRQSWENAWAQATQQIEGEKTRAREQQRIESVTDNIARLMATGYPYEIANIQAHQTAGYPLDTREREMLDTYHKGASRKRFKEPAFDQEPEKQEEMKGAKERESWKQRMDAFLGTAPHLRAEEKPGGTEPDLNDADMMFVLDSYALFGHQGEVSPEIQTYLAKLQRERPDTWITHPYNPAMWGKGKPPVKREAPQQEQNPQEAHSQKRGRKSRRKGKQSQEGSATEFSPDDQLIRSISEKLEQERLFLSDEYD